MIGSILHKGLKRLHEDDDPRGVNAEHVEKLRDILARLDAAGVVADMDMPGFKLHPLKGSHGDAQDVDYAPHPDGFLLRQCIQPLGLTITDAAAALGVTRTSLSELVHGHRGISPEMAVRLSKAFGGSAQSCSRNRHSMTWLRSALIASRSGGSISWRRSLISML